MEVAVGFLIAVVIALTGVGGGVLTAPLLILWKGLPAAESVGTALLFVTIVKTLAVPVYLQRRQVNFSVLARMLAGGVPGVAAGSFVLHRASHGGLSDLVLSILGATVVVSAVLNLARPARPLEPGSAEKGQRWLPALSAGIGLEVGFSSAGAGALGTAALLRCTRLLPAEVVGTDLLFGFVLAAIGGGAHLVAATFNAGVLVKLACGGICGAVAGAHLATVLPARALRVVLSAALLCVGLQLCFRGIGALAAGR